MPKRLKSCYVFSTGLRVINSSSFFWSSSSLAKIKCCLFTCLPAVQTEPSWIAWPSVPNVQKVPWCSLTASAVLSSSALINCGSYCGCQGSHSTELVCNKRTSQGPEVKYLFRLLQIMPIFMDFFSIDEEICCHRVVLSCYGRVAG